MLIAKGYSPSFEMKEGGTIRASLGAALLHDPTGHAWPSCSGLVMPFARRRAPLERDVDIGDAEEYFGRKPLIGHVTVPSKALTGWRSLGAIEVINYRRVGRHKASYYHPIEKGTATLYRKGRLLRVELGRGCEWTWRGIVKP